MGDNETNNWPTHFKLDAHGWHIDAGGRPLAYRQRPPRDGSEVVHLRSNYGFASAPSDDSSPLSELTKPLIIAQQRQKDNGGRGFDGNQIGADAQHSIALIL